MEAGVKVVVTAVVVMVAVVKVEAVKEGAVMVVGRVEGWVGVAMAVEEPVVVMVEATAAVEMVEGRGGEDLAGEMVDPQNFHPHSSERCEKRTMGCNDSCDYSLPARSRNEE